MKNPLFRNLFLWRPVAAAGLLTSLFLSATSAQQAFFTRDDVIKYTADWKSERFEDGRPKVPDAILDRMKKVTLEEAWAELRNAGFNHQFEDGWMTIHPGAGPGRPSSDCTVDAGSSRRAEGRRGAR